MNAKTYEVNVTQCITATIDGNAVKGLLEEKRKELLDGWETIIVRTDGTGYFYDHGYGSHSIGQNMGPEVPKDVLDVWKAFTTVIAQFN